jgi:hypothetical protein
MPMFWLMHHKGILTASIIGLLALSMILTVVVDTRRRR